MGTILGAVGSVFLWFWLARAQWRGVGKWGGRIAVLSLVVLAVQSFLVYLAVSRGRIAVDARFVTNFGSTVVMAVVLSGCGFVSYAQYRQRA